MQTRDATQYLRSLVQDHAVPVYSAYSGTRAMAITGSAARGLVDYVSDIDTIIYYDQLPTEEEILTMRAEVGGTDGNWYGKDPEHGYAEYYFINGVKADFGHSRIDEWEAIIDDVLLRYDTDKMKHKMMSGIADSFPVYGHDLIESYKARARQFPDELAEKMVREHLRFSPVWVVRDMIAMRGDVLWLHEFLVKMENNVLGILLGLNRLYHPGEFKRMDWLISGMTIAPENLSARLKAVFAASPSQSVDLLTPVIAKTLDLVDAHLPHIDTQETRQFHNMPTMGWEWPA